MECDLRKQVYAYAIYLGELWQLLCLNSSHLPGTLLTRSVEIAITSLRPHGKGCSCREPQRNPPAPATSHWGSDARPSHPCVSTAQLRLQWKKPSQGRCPKPPLSAQAADVPWNHRCLLKGSADRVLWTHMAPITSGCHPTP